MTFPKAFPKPTQRSRRGFLAGCGAALLPTLAQKSFAQRGPAPAINPTPTARDWSGQTTIQYPDPDIVALDNRFRKYMIGNTSIKRLYTGTLWSEGPAWNGVGRFLVWSDIPNNVQMRWIEEDGRVTVFRNPSGYSNGNTFDFEGRQLSCEHGGRRVVRYEYNGTVTVIADKFQGKRLNSPNDIAVHQDGSIWFTDPTYGIQGNYEGFQATPELKTAVYRADSKTGQVEKVSEEASQPNGICFSPDYKKVYIADTGDGETRIYDVDGRTLRNGKRFVKLQAAPGIASAADGIRCDVDGNLWCGARPGVQIVAPDGTQIGMIRLPENCANISFGGTKRNRLFMAASQSLYSVYVGTTGAAPA
jgi:gluconolactonase